jgi:glycerol-3-phosphate O-acyltransferase
VEAWALRLRDLLKFEFFFPERDPFLRDVEREAQALAREEQAGAPAMGAAGPRLVLDYLEGYWVAMRALETLPQGAPPLPRNELSRRCLAIGRQLLLQGRVAAPELLTSVNFRNALQLAENQGALRSGPEGYVVTDANLLRALAHDLDTLATAARR